MTDAVPAPAGAALQAQPPQGAARVRDAARQFEALLLSQILKSMREASSAGWLGSGQDAAGATATEMAEEQFAQALAQRGGLGLADLIESQLSPRPAPVPSPAPAAEESAQPPAGSCDPPPASPRGAFHGQTDR
jgi:peptidoglycan hydrolase FlgJ